MIWIPSSELFNRYSLNLKDSKEIDQSLKDQIWSIFESNMRQMCAISHIIIFWGRSWISYENTDVFDWNPSEKQAEMFHELARFLLIFAKTSGSCEERKLLAYSIFRFEREDRRNVIYVYVWFIWSISTHAILNILGTSCRRRNQRDALGLGGYSYTIWIILARTLAWVPSC